MLESPGPRKPIPDTSRVAVLFSGGIDSAVLLAELLGTGSHVQPFYVATGCVWQDAELEAVGRFLDAVAQPDLAPLVRIDMPLQDLYDGHWSMTGVNVPDDSTDDEAVYLPGRNPLLLLKPALWCQLHGIGQLALGTLAANPFADSTAEFLRPFEQMLQAATGCRVEIVQPLAQYEKRSAMLLGPGLPLELTFSCMAPVEGMHCGKCNKCAERFRAFEQLNWPDPTEYHQPPGRHHISVLASERCTSSQPGY